MIGVRVHYFIFWTIFFQFLTNFVHRQKVTITDLCLKLTLRILTLNLVELLIFCPSIFGRNFNGKYYGLSKVQTPNFLNIQQCFFIYSCKSNKCLLSTPESISRFYYDLRSRSKGQHDLSST